jgi:acetyl esterase/lipase
MKSLFLAASLMASTAPFAQSASQESLPIPHPDIANTVVHKDAFPKVMATFANGVWVLPDVRYWTPYGFRPLTMDIYLPPQTMTKPAAGFPMVMYIHGGGWMSGDSHAGDLVVDFPGLLADMAARGYVVASVNYRLSSEATWPAQGQDIKAAIKFLRLHAADYGIDPERFVTWGMSAGGHLSGIAATTCGVAALQPRQPDNVINPTGEPDKIVEAKVSDCVQGAVAWYGVFDLSTEAEQARREGAAPRDVPGAPEWLLLGCFKEKCPPGRIRSASPVSYVNRTTPPMLLLTGDKDGIVPYDQTLQMDAALTKAGVKHETHVYPGSDHGFYGATPEATQQINQDAIERTIRFIDATIGASRIADPGSH